jgi:hypothetical protein
MIRNLQSAWQNARGARFRSPELSRSGVCRRVAPVALAYAFGLAIWFHPSDVHSGVNPAASASLVPVHWWGPNAPRASGKAKDQRADTAKQKDKARSGVCWGRRRVGPRWKLAFIC